MSYNPNIHHRRSIRLRGYDYVQAGAYFVTICTQGREETILHHSCKYGTLEVGKK